jgi:hypothetical protein
MAVAVARPLQSGNGKHIDVEVTLRSFVRLIESGPLGNSSASWSSHDRPEIYSWCLTFITSEPFCGIGRRRRIPSGAWADPAPGQLKHIHRQCIDLMLLNR